MVKRSCRSRFVSAVVVVVLARQKTNRTEERQLFHGGDVLAGCGGGRPVRYGAVPFDRNLVTVMILLQSIYNCAGNS